MFNSSKAEPRRGGLSVIGAGVVVTGNVRTESDLHIDGTVEGDIRCGGLVQGKTGRIVGSVTAASARIAGTVEGQIDAAALTIQTGARITGDSVYDTLTVETGAHVDGRVTRRGGGTEPPLRLVDATEPAG